MTSTAPVRVSVIVPVYNNPQDLQECVAALLAGDPPDTEIIVVDDGSADDAAQALAVHPGVTVLRLAKNSGPSPARNYGARHARGEFLFFVDSDVVVTPGAVNRVCSVLENNPKLAAVFGSYDAQPRAQGLVSQYRNLLHHYVHQTDEPAASTFWGGCGAIRRSVFEQLSGFDERRFPRYMEDVELGYRVREAGHRILLDKDLQGTHLKRWTLRSMVKTDIFHRAVPWTRLILERNQTPNHLNLRAGQRMSVFLVALAMLLLAMAPIRLVLLAPAGGALLSVIVVNRGLYGFFFRRRGPFFAAVSIPLHFLYYACGGLAYFCVWCSFRLRPAETRPPVLSETRF